MEVKINRVHKIIQDTNNKTKFKIESTKISMITLTNEVTYTYIVSLSTHISRIGLSHYLSA